MQRMCFFKVQHVDHCPLVPSEEQGGEGCHSLCSAADSPDLYE